MAEREATINALLTWGGQQKERRLALASKIEWESHDSSGLDISHLTDHQKEERLAYERCGFIFAMYHADTWWCEIWDLVRPLLFCSFARQTMRCIRSDSAGRELRAEVVLVGGYNN